MTQIWGALIHFLLVAFIRFLPKVESSLREITARLMAQRMENNYLLELLTLDRKTLARLPDWNAPRQLEYFGELVTCILTGKAM